MRRHFIRWTSGAAVVAALGLGSAAAGTPVAPDPASLGLWLTEKKGVLVELYPCADAVCGRIVWLRKPFRRSGEIRRDRHNPDPNLRSRLWCGSEVIEGLKPDAEGKLGNGRFYYLGDGATYDLDLKPDGNGTLEATAYLGVKLLGKTETWTRPDPSIAPGCPPES